MQFVLIFQVQLFDKCLAKWRFFPGLFIGFVAADVGIGLISRSNVEEDVRAKSLAAVPLADAQVRRDLALVFRKDKALSRAALAFMSRKTPDLIIQDLELPGVDGHELLSQMKNNADVPVLACTGYPDRAPSPSAWADLLIKPVEPSQILRSVKSLLTRREVPAGSADLISCYRVSCARALRTASPLVAPRPLTAPDANWQVNRHPASVRSPAMLRASWVARSPAGCRVIPSRRTRRVRCSITNATCRRLSVSAQSTWKKSAARSVAA